ncbi:hypothetical protein HYQ46_000741 [Verticillium longisporum]|nr:hypothetical protein HYQ46_000741 [Verticillium longisporum]
MGGVVGNLALRSPAADQAASLAGFLLQPQHGLVDGMRHGSNPLARQSQIRAGLLGKRLGGSGRVEQRPLKFVCSSDSGVMGVAAAVTSGRALTFFNNEGRRQLLRSELRERSVDARNGRPGRRGDVGGYVDVDALQRLLGDSFWCVLPVGKILSPPQASQSRGTAPRIIVVVINLIISIFGVVDDGGAALVMGGFSWPRSCDVRCWWREARQKIWREELSG